MPKIGIMLVLGNKEVVSMRNSLNIQIVDRIPPHITLYVLEINPKDKELIKDKAELMSKKCLPIELYITNTKNSSYGTLMLLVKNSSNLQKFHEELVKELVKFRDKQAFSKAKKFYNEFTKEEQGLIDNYGRPDVMQKFDPHITLGKTNEPIKLSLNKKIKIDNITVYFDEGNGWEKI